MTAPADSADSVCPLCSKVLDGQTPLTGKGAPVPGDFSLCFYCGAMLRFTAELGVRLATAAERDELGFEQLVTMMRAQRAILARGEKAKILGVTADSRTVPHRQVECDRCGRQMSVPVLKLEVPIVTSNVCTDCLPWAMKELELPEKRGIVVFPKTWARSRRPRS